MNRPTCLLLLPLLVACPPSGDDDDASDDDVADDDASDDDVADDDASDDDASDDDSSPGDPPRVWMFADDPEGSVASAYDAFVTGLGLETSLAAYDDASAIPAAADLVVLLPDLPRDASDEAPRLTAHGGPVLGLGVGGARAYEGLEVGLGTGDGGQGAVDKMEVDASAVDHPIFAGIDVPADRVVAVTTSAVTDVGIIPSGDVVALAWDYRYPGTYADICSNGRYWFWGWGGASDGVPDDLTADGATVFGALVEWLLDPVD
ncbi:hypothetical protein L6R50_16375 [Myxococcota bacterium]|nr:hypothetical protein [Myxococcota bacterium]